LVIEVKVLAANFGNKFQKPIKLAKVTVIFGKHIKLSFLKRPMSVLAKKVDRQIIWNVGITR
jgi:hypothetical protein